MSDDRDEFHVCVICSGNICRSPYAEVLLRHAVEEAALGDRILITSAGTYGIYDRPAHDSSIAAAADRGLNLLSFRSRGLELEEFPEIDLFVVLGREHVRWFAERLPPEDDRLWLITAPGGPPPGDDPGIFDPIGASDEEYRRSIEAIDAAIPPLLEAIRARFGLG